MFILPSGAQPVPRVSALWILPDAEVLQHCVPAAALESRAQIYLQRVWIHRCCICRAWAMRSLWDLYRQAFPLHRVQDSQVLWQGVPAPFVEEAQGSLLEGEGG